MVDGKTSTSAPLFLMVFLILLGLSRLKAFRLILSDLNPLRGWVGPYGSLFSDLIASVDGF